MVVDPQSEKNPARKDEGERCVPPVLGKREQQHQEALQPSANEHALGLTGAHPVHAMQGVKTVELSEKIREKRDELIRSGQMLEQLPSCTKFHHLGACLVFPSRCKSKVVGELKQRIYVVKGETTDILESANKMNKGHRSSKEELERIKGYLLRMKDSTSKHQETAGLRQSSDAEKMGYFNKEKQKHRLKEKIGCGSSLFTCCGSVCAVCLFDKTKSVTAAQIAKIPCVGPFLAHTSVHHGWFGALSTTTSLVPGTPCCLAASACCLGCSSCASTIAVISARTSYVMVQCDELACLNKEMIDILLKNDLEHEKSARENCPLSIGQEKSSQFSKNNDVASQSNKKASMKTANIEQDQADLSSCMSVFNRFLSSVSCVNSSVRKSES